jgi:ubiquinone/menaquinone biosynthesis C-methylase UbiE
MARPTYIERTVQSYEDAADAYCERTSSFDRFPGLKEEVEEFSTLAVGRVVLELGVGSGRDFALLDMSSALTIAGDACLAFLTRLHDAKARLQLCMRELPIREASVGAVWCCATLLHLTIDDASLAVSEVARVLEPGGVAAISVKQGHTEAGFVSAPHMRERWFTYFTESDLTDLAIGAGLGVISVSSRATNESTWLTLLAER